MDEAILSPRRSGRASRGQARQQIPRAFSKFRIVHDALDEPAGVVGSRQIESGHAGVNSAASAHVIIRCTGEFLWSGAAEISDV